MLSWRKSQRHFFHKTPICGNPGAVTDTGVSSTKGLTNTTECGIVIADFDESKHKRDERGRFSDKDQRGAKARQSLELEKKYNDDLPIRERIFLPDEILPRSIGARWSNEDISMPDGTIAHFQEGSKITHKEVFAGKGCKIEIRDVERLTKKFPGTKAELWQKVKGRAEIVWGTEYLKAEIHWYEEPSVGKQEIKYKKEL